MGRNHQGFRKASRKPSSQSPPNLLPISSHRTKVGIYVLFPLLLLFGMGYAHRGTVKPNSEEWDTIVTNEGEKIECQILDMGFLDIKIKPKYGFTNYSIPRNDIQQIRFRDGRELVFLNGVGMPPESLAKRKEQEKEVERNAEGYNRHLYGTLGMVVGGIAAMPLIRYFGPKVFISPIVSPLVLLFPPLNLVLALPVIGGVAGYNYGKRRDIEEARMKTIVKPRPDFLKPKPDSITIRLQKMLRK